MPNIFDSKFEEVTFIKSKTNTVFLEDDVCTLWENHYCLKIYVPWQDIIYDNYATCLQFCISDEDIVIVYKDDELSSYIIHSFKSFYKDLFQFTLEVSHNEGKKWRCVC